jgi:hypothetical protein
MGRDPLLRLKFERSVMKPVFVQFVSVPMVEVMRVFKYFNDFLEDTGMVNVVVQQNTFNLFSYIVS